MALGAVMAWHYRIHLLTNGINLLLAGDGLRQMQYELGTIDFSGASLPRLNFELSGEGKTHSIRTSDLTLWYSMENIYAGTIDRIHIKQLLINSYISGNGETDGDSVHIGTVIGSLVSVISQTVPVSHITIDEVVISNNGLDLTPAGPVKFVMDAHDKVVEIKLLQGKSALNINIENTNTNQNQFSTTLIDHNLDTIFAGKIVLTDKPVNTINSTTAEFFFELSKIRTWLKDLQQIELPDMAGTLTVSLTAKIRPGQDQWNTIVSGNISGFSAGLMKIPDGELELDLSVPGILSADNYAIFLRPGSRLKMAELVFDQTKLVNVLATPSGEMGMVDDTFFHFTRRNVITRIRLDDLPRPVPVEIPNHSGSTFIFPGKTNCRWP